MVANQNQPGLPLKDGVLSNAASLSDTVLLPTAEMYVFNKIGTTYHYRALVDSGSEWSFVSERLVSALSLKRQQVDCSIIRDRTN